MEGVIVAGGRSTRFGEHDKAVADLAGTPMVRRVADRLAAAVEAVVVNCRPEQVAPIADALDGLEADAGVAVRFAEDREPDRGPTAGIRTGLRIVGSEYAAVVACDTPFLDPSFLAHLRERATGHDAAVPEFDGWRQTTHAVYCTAPTAEACERALARGDRRTVAVLDHLDAVVVPESTVRDRTDPRTFLNVNTPADLERAAEHLS